jgi:2-octaprenyl-6-methoxyphenol hydroxylase
VDRLKERDVIIVGTGPAGLVTALALAREGVSVTLVGETAPEPRGRTIALFDGSVRLLAELGAWGRLAPKAAPLRKLRIVDDTQNLFRWPELSFDASEIGLDVFGWNIGAEDLSTALRRLAGATRGIRLVEGLAGDARFGGPERQDLASVAVGGERLAAPLVVAADGQRSRLREGAGLAARFGRLPQSAIIAILRHELPHEDGSTEFHLRGGPCTLVPVKTSLEEQSAAREEGLRYASSLVWMMANEAAEEVELLDDAAFALTLERRVHSMLGKMQVLSPRAIVPLATLNVRRIVASRLALVGEAAHAFPPIGAQGLNLGLRDAAALALHVGEALREGRDIGGSDVLDAYAHARRADIATRETAVNLMNRSLLSSFLPVDLARGVGMAALDLVPPLRRFVMRQGIEPGFAAPRSGARARGAMWRSNP